MYYLGGMKAQVSHVPSIESHIILAPTRGSNHEPPAPQLKVVTIILPLHTECFESVIYSPTTVPIESLLRQNEN